MSANGSRSAWWLVGILSTVIVAGGGVGLSAFLAYGDAASRKEVDIALEQLRVQLLREMTLMVPKDTVGSRDLVSLREQISQMRDDIREIRTLVIQMSPNKTAGG